MNDKTLIIGVGSPFGTDELGWRVVDVLLQQQLLDECDVLKLDRPGLSLLDYMTGREHVIIVDAMKTNAEPGTLHRIKPEQVEASLLSTMSTHEAGLAQTLKLGASLGLLPRRLNVLGINVGEAEGLEEEWVNRLVDHLNNSFLRA